MSPVTPETLRTIRENIDKANASIKSLRDIVSDMRASGIDASGYESQIQALEAQTRQWETFYHLQIARQ